MTPNISGLILDEVKDLWRVVLLISILFCETLSQEEDELHRRKVKYIKVERSITNLGEVMVGRICASLITSVEILVLQFTNWLFFRSWWGVEVQAIAHWRRHNESYAGQARSADWRMGMPPCNRSQQLLILKDLNATPPIPCHRKNGC